MTDHYAQIAQLFADECVTHAFSVLASREPQGPRERWLHEYWTLRLSAPLAEDRERRIDLDSVYVRLRRLVDSPDADPLYASRSLRVMASLHAARRLRDLAFADLQEAEERFGFDGAAAAARIGFHLAFDELDAAREVAERARRDCDGEHVRLSHAALLYTVGDFDGALSALAIDFSPVRRLDAADLRRSIHASRGDLRAELAALDEAIHQSPDADTVAVRHLARAHVHAALDDLGRCRDDLDKALSTAPSEVRSHVGEYVRHRLDALDVATDATPRRRLSAFPSVVQRWNYCGPAVIELCLRFSGVQMTQDVIAAAVKRGEGTAPRAIVEFFREQGFEARRIEATADVVRRAIDLGYPVILQSDYTNTRHVSVAIGYDDRLGVLVIADPLTHAPVLQAVESRSAVAGSEGYAGIVVLGRSDELTPERLREADGAGLVESAHLTMLDEIDSNDASTVAEFARATPLEAAGIAAKVLAIKPDFTLATVVSLGGLFGSGSAYESLFVPALAEARVRDAQQSRVAAIAASWNLREGRSHLAIAEATLAVRANPRDADAHIQLGTALAQSGEWDEAFDSLARAVALAPHAPVATAALARLLRDELLRRALDRGTVPPEFGAVCHASEPRATLTRLDDVDLDATTRQVLRVAAEMGDDRVNVPVIQGDLAFLDGDFAQAARCYRAAWEEAPDWNVPSLRLLHVYEQSDPGELAALLDALLLDARRDPQIASAVVDALQRSERYTEAADHAVRTLDSGGDPAGMMPRWFAALAAASSPEDAARALVAYAQRMRHRPDITDTVLEVLDDRGMQMHGAALLQRLVDDRPDDVSARFRLALVLASAPGRRDEAIVLLEEAQRQAPWASAVRYQLAWLLMASDPGRAYDIAQSVDDDILGIELKRVASAHAGHREQSRDHARVLAQARGSRFKAELAIGHEYLRMHHVRALPWLALDDRPDPSDVSEVAAWCALARTVGRGVDVAEFLERRTELLAVPAIAQQYVRISEAADPVSLARACRMLVHESAETALQRELEVRALLAEEQGGAAEARAGDDASCLVLVSDGLAVPGERARVAVRAHELAPHDAGVLAALHRAMVDVGAHDAAWQAARELVDRHPFGHQGFERLGQCEVMWGDVSRGLDLVRQASEVAPFCTEAPAVLAMAHAQLGQWEEAERYAVRSLAGGRRRGTRVNAAALVLAAVRGDDAALRREIAVAESDSPGGAYERLISAVA